MNTSLQIDSTFLTKVVGIPAAPVKETQRKPLDSFITPKKTSIKELLAKASMETPKSPRILDFPKGSNSSAKKAFNVEVYRTPENPMRTGQKIGSSKVILSNKKFQKLIF